MKINSAAQRRTELEILVGRLCSSLYTIHICVSVNYYKRKAVEIQEKAI